MNTKAFLGLALLTSILAFNSAKADMHVRGADGPAANPFVRETFVLFLGEVLASNVDDSAITCAEDYADDIETILKDSQNKKLFLAPKNKQVGAFLKQLGVVSKPNSVQLLSLFEEAAQAAVDSICSEEGDPDSNDPDPDSGDSEL